MNRDDLVSAMQATAAEKPRALETKKWGTVYIKSPSVAEIEAQIEESATVDEGGSKHQIAKGAARILCDAEGNRIFDPNSLADLLLLESQPWDLLQEVTDAFGKSARGN